MTKHTTKILLTGVSSIFTDDVRMYFRMPLYRLVLMYPESCDIEKSFDQRQLSAFRFRVRVLSQDCQSAYHNQ